MNKKHNRNFNEATDNSIDSPHVHDFPRAKVNEIKLDRHVK